MATNYKNSNYLRVDNAKQTIPSTANGTGTIVTEGKHVVGTNTLFLSEMPVGSWIYSASQNEIRKVVNVIDNTKAYLSNAFTVDLVAAAPAIIHARNTNVKAISVAIKAGLADGAIDGVTLSNGTGMTFSKDGNSMKAIGDYVDPIIADGTGTVIQAQLMY